MAYYRGVTELRSHSVYYHVESEINKIDNNLNSILFYPLPLHAIGKNNRNNLIEKLKSQLKGHIESDYIFGSFLTDELEKLIQEGKQRPLSGNQ